MPDRRSEESERAMVGYQSEAAFQRVFKQHMGLTPARWRRAEESQ